MPASPEMEILHRSRPNHASAVHHHPDEAILPTSSANDAENVDISDQVSVALSEADTLRYTKQQRLRLQESYNENFTAYIPFLAQQLRQHQRRTDVRDDVFKEDDISDDDKTVTLQSLTPMIMGKDTQRFEFKRTMVVVSELIKNTIYVFPSRDLFQKFKELRLKSKSLRKNSAILYDGEGNIRKIAKSGKDEFESQGTVDSRNHIIPLEYKIKGVGLPLFKVLVPYMLNFRKKVPYMIFRRYREVPNPPARVGEEEDEKFELYNFCTIHFKAFHLFKRYTLQFTPQGEEPFKIIVFQNNFTPFTDFNYLGTRFRITGSSLATAYLMSYIPQLKLYVLDDTQPSLCDNLVNKKLGSDFLKKKEGDDFSPQTYASPEDFPNPVPSSDNQLLRDEDWCNSRTSKLPYVPTNMPPFGMFLDSCIYNDEMLFLPKRYSEIGMVEAYQDTATFPNPDVNTTYSVDTDSTVFTIIFIMLRETSIRTTNRTSNASMMGRMSALTLGPQPWNASFGSLAVAM